jgi:hypothetical protein
MLHSENKHRLRRVLPRAARRRTATGFRPLLPLLAPFLVSLVFVLLYCGPNIPRGLGCLVTSRLVLASGHRNRPGLGTNGSRTFSAYTLGERIGAVVRNHCGKRPSWWSLDFWVDPDPYDVISVENRPSAGAEDGVRRLLAGPGARARADLAIVQDGLVADGTAPPGQVRSLVMLYRSVLFSFAPKGGRVERLTDLRGRNPRVYTGQVGSGARVLAGRVLNHLGIDY